MSKHFWRTVTILVLLTLLCLFMAIALVVKRNTTTPQPGQPAAEVSQTQTPAQPQNALPSPTLSLEEEAQGFFEDFGTFPFNDPAWDAFETQTGTTPLGDPRPSTAPNGTSAAPPVAPSSASTAAGQQPLFSVPNPTFAQLFTATHSSAPKLSAQPHKRLAIVIDDMGVAAENSEEALSLPATVTFAFLPYGDATQTLIQTAHAQGHEVILHLPMQPKLTAAGTMPNPGPNALMLTDTPQTIARKTAGNIAALKPYITGVNNHMGSAFSEWPAGLRAAFEVIAAENLYYLDSLTTAQSAVPIAATGLNLPILTRHVFLDHSQQPADIFMALSKAVRWADTHGSAIAIGHPHPQTLAILSHWLPTLQNSPIELVPLRALLENNNQNQ